MKPLKQLFKPISYLLSLLILLQGCTVYKTQNVTLQQAAETKDKVKILTKDGETQKYLYVTPIKEEYYGIKKVDGKPTKFLLQEENIEILRTENKAASFGYTMLLGIPTIVAVIIIGTLIAGDEGGFVHI